MPDATTRVQRALDLACALPLRIVATLTLLALVTLAIISVHSRMELATPSGHVLVADLGGVMLGRENSPTSRPDKVETAVTPNKNRYLELPAAGAMGVPNNPPYSLASWSSTTTSGVFLSPFHPCIILAAYAGFAWAWARRPRARPPRLWLRLALTTLALALIPLCLTWRSARHKYITRTGYVAFTGGGLTIGRDHPGVGSYRLKSHATLLPHKTGPRALEFPDCFNLYIPLWHAAILTTAVATYTWGRAARHRAQTEPLCLNCGYPLRGLTSPTCPECGRALQ